MLIYPENTLFWDCFLLLPQIKPILKEDYHFNFSIINFGVTRSHHANQP